MSISTLNYVTIDPEEALTAFEAHPEATIYVSGSMYAVTMHPCCVCFAEWQQSSPEELEARIASDAEARRP